MIRVIGWMLPVGCAANVAAALWVHNVPAAVGWAMATVYALRGVR